MAWSWCCLWLSFFAIRNVSALSPGPLLISITTSKIFTVQLSEPSQPCQGALRMFPSPCLWFTYLFPPHHTTWYLTGVQGYTYNTTSCHVILLLRGTLVKVCFLDRGYSTKKRANPTDVDIAFVSHCLVLMQELQQTIVNIELIQKNLFLVYSVLSIWHMQKLQQNLQQNLQL